MSLSEFEQHIIAYYVADSAGDLTVIDRYYSTGEMILIIEDKIQLATHQFGIEVTSQANAAATAFLEQMIAAGAFSTTRGKLGAAMHQLQAVTYRRVLAEQRESNPILQKMKTAGPDFWKQTFAAMA